jgi:TolB-like protein/Tfp pilus assembly protein PilF
MEQAKGARLDSWKAIARYLGRDIRSVQRWERERGLPIHRVPGVKGGTIFAYQGELDAWLLSGRGETSLPSDPEPAHIAHDTGDSGPAGGNPAGAVPPAAVTLPEPPSTPRGVPLLWYGAGGLLLVLAAVAVAFWRYQHSASPPRSIAVLPLRNLSGDAGQDYFVDGLTEELTAEITQLRSLRVIATSSTMHYKGSADSPVDIAKKLGVTLVLQGSVTREGNRVRVTSQLIDAATGTYLTARTEDAEVKDLLEVQHRIARDIAGEVRLRLSTEEKARLASVSEIDPQALDLYLRGRYQYAQQTADSIRQSLELFRAAVARAPTFARAYVGIAEAETALLQITAQTPEESFRQERDALDQALRIDPHLGEAHGLLASIYYWHDWDWPQAERQFRAALAEGALAPTEQRFGSALVSRSLFREGMVHLQSALELDPLGMSPRVNQFFGAYFQRDFAAARRQMAEVLDRNPDFLSGHALLGLTATVEHDCATAEQQAQWTRSHFPSPLAEFLAALASVCRGDSAEARRDLERADAASGKPFPSSYQLALGYTLIHDNDTALAYLARSADMHEPQILYLRVDPMLDSIRTDARFVALEKRVHLL